MMTIEQTRALLAARRKPHGRLPKRRTHVFNIKISFTEPHSETLAIAKAREAIGGWFTVNDGFEEIFVRSIQRRKEKTKCP